MEAEMSFYIQKQLKLHLPAAAALYCLQGSTMAEKAG